jgi:NAD-dependent deacetylase
MDEVSEIVARSNLFAAIGTSGSVYPAAGLVGLAASHGVWTCELNLAPSENHNAFDEAHYGPASAVVSEWVETLINNKNTTGSYSEL